MSIISSNRYTSKRRKLSHGSNDGAPRDQHISRDSEGGQRASDSDPEIQKPARKNYVYKRSTTSTSIMSTGGLTKSSLMQIQINELVEEIKPDYEAHLRNTKQLTDKLVQSIKSISDRAPASFVEAEKSLRKKHGVAIPFGPNRPSPDAKYKFEYKQPARIRLRGEVVQHLCTKQNLRLEIAVHMPAELFQEKDYLNHRVFHKRAHYTACIAAGLKQSLGRECELHYEFLYGNLLLPVIVVAPAKSNTSKTAQHIKIVINTVLPNSVAPLEKLNPSRNCVRVGQSEGAQVSPTPFYNTTLCALMSTTSVDQLLEDTARKCDAFVDACLLGQTWLHQRGFSGDVSAGGFGVSEWTYMCALLLHGGGHKGQALFSDRYSSLQLFKAMLQVLANRDLTQPLLVRTLHLNLEQGEVPVLYDGHTGINVFVNTNRWSYDLLRHMAQLSLTAVNAHAHVSFVPTFIAKVAEPNLQFDEVYTLSRLSLGLSNSAASDLYELLKKGFGDRVSLLVLKEGALGSWDLGLPEPSQIQIPQTIQVQLSVNTETISRLIDRGPAAEEQEEAREYYKFWDGKSEQRKFRDGSITETMTWSADTSVTLQILQLLAAKYFRSHPGSTGSKGPIIKSGVPDLENDCLTTGAPISAEDAFKLINNKCQELSSKLHQIEGLPLPIRSVSLAGEALRSASVGHPLDSVSSKPIGILIQFDSSARWPDHLPAIQHTKIAFLAKISDLVTESDTSVTTRIGLENEDTFSAGYKNASFLDIVFPSLASGLTPLVFRLRIHHERELQLLQDQLASKDLTLPTREIVSSALLDHKRTFVASANHTNSLRNLITQFQPLSTTIRLLKSWFASHNLSNHVLDPTVEVVAAHIFLHPYPWSTSGNPTTAFLRCLYFLSQWDWSTSPLIVDLSLSQDMTGAQLTELETRYQAWRKLDPNMNTVAWFVGTNTDTTGTMWTQGAKPARVVAGRVTALAKAAIELVKARGSDMLDGDWKSLFISPTSDFDFVIHLKSSVVRGGKRSKKNGAVQFKNLQVHEDLDVDSIGHDKASLYLADLERAFANVVLFFHGEQGKYIAGLWRPGVVGQKDWRVRLGYSSIPYPGQGKNGEDQTKDVAVINKEAILSEIALLGKDMIEKISVRE